MEKTVRHSQVYFDSATIRRAIAQFEREVANAVESVGDLGEFSASNYATELNGSVVAHVSEEWKLDTLEEFLADHAKARGQLTFDHSEFVLSTFVPGGPLPSMMLRLIQYPSRARVSVTGLARSSIEAVHAVFADAAPSLRVDPPVDVAAKPRIFIGHGGSSRDWRDLHDHLRDQHGLDVFAYETGSRSGHSIRDILDEMLSEATFAILVYTPEDEQAGGNFRARQNVIHETGLFQGRLGFPRAIVVRREGVDMLSNLDGVQYLPYTANIRETFGDVLGAIRREFGAF